MLRSAAIQARRGAMPRSARLLACTDLQGKIATTIPFLVNAADSSRLARTIMEKTAGIARDRLLPSFAKVRFTKWFRRRVPDASGPSRGSVALFPPCLVDDHDTTIG